MTGEGNRPCQTDEFDDPAEVGWTAAESLLQAQAKGNRAMEEYLLLTHYQQRNIDPRSLQVLLDDVITTHEEILEDLECAREAVDHLAEVTAGSQGSGEGVIDPEKWTP
ncbi:MAG: hypothetical protein ABEI31_01520 [Halodesulfurarchaeum sp.]